MTQTQTTTRSVNPAGAVAPALAGTAAIAMAIYQVARPGTPSATYDGLLDWLRELIFLLYLLGSIAAMTRALRSGLATRWPAALVRGGYALIAIGVTAGMILQEDPDWFFVLGGPGQLAGIVGFVWFAVSGYRRRLLPPWAALLAGVGGVTAILMSELGTSVLIGAFWLWLAATRQRPTARS
jgi:hypothetical protein